MHIILCLDDRNGISFNNRRVSSDRAVCQRISDNATGELWMNRYSAKLFAEHRVRVDEDFLDKAGLTDSCFAENLDFLQRLDKIESVTVYRWNRHYPSDVKFSGELLSTWKLTAATDFPGNSHDIITEEKYVL